MVVHWSARRVLPRREIVFVFGANPRGGGRPDSVRHRRRDRARGAAPSDEPEPAMKLERAGQARTLDLPPRDRSSRGDQPLDAEELDDLRRLEAHFARRREGQDREEHAQLERVSAALLLWTDVRNVGRAQLTLIAAILQYFVPLWRPIWRGPESMPDDLGAARALVATLRRELSRYHNPSIRLPFPPFRDVLARLSEPELGALRERLSLVDERLELLALEAP